MGDGPRRSQCGAAQALGCLWPRQVPGPPARAGEGAAPANSTHLGCARGAAPPVQSPWLPPAEDGVGTTVVPWRGPRPRTPGLGSWLPRARPREPGGSARWGAGELSPGLLVSLVSLTKHRVRDSVHRAPFRAGSGGAGAAATRGQPCSGATGPRKMGGRGGETRPSPGESGALARGHGCRRRRPLQEGGSAAQGGCGDVCRCGGPASQAGPPREARLPGLLSGQKGPGGPPAHLPRIPSAGQPAGVSAAGGGPWAS